MTDKRAKSKKDSGNPIVRFFANLGPGLITGAADDDPSGIATYSTAGALLGTGQLWTALITWPLMASVQMMCARIGMVTGAGLAGALRKKFPKPLIVIAASALLVANTINIGADLSGMADAAEMLSGINSHYFVILFGLAIAVATVQFRYHQIANVLKWLALTLFAYVITGFVIGPDWSKVAHDTFVPSLPKGHEGWAMLVAILGTTISPYLFFWQSSQEVEEEKAIGRRMLAWRQGATRREIGVRKMDVGTGTFFSNLVMYFIILSTALTLHAHGTTNIETTKQAAEALLPLAGKSAYLLLPSGSSVSAFSPSRLSPVRPRMLSRRHLAGDRDLIQNSQPHAPSMALLSSRPSWVLRSILPGSIPSKRFIGPRSLTACLRLFCWLASGSWPRTGRSCRTSRVLAWAWCPWV